MKTYSECQCDKESCLNRRDLVLCYSDIYSTCKFYNVDLHRGDDRNAQRPANSDVNIVSKLRNMGGL